MTEPTEPNRPTPPRVPGEHPRPEVPTEPLPPAAGPPPQTPPPSGPPPSGPPPYAAGAAEQPQPRKPGLWRQATSSTGGLVAVVVAACLVALLVLGLLGAGAFLAARVVAGHDHGSRVERLAQGRDGALPPGAQRKLDRLPEQRVLPRGQGPGAGRGDGLGPLLRGVDGLGAVQHGEFTVQGSDGKATAMTMQRGSVTAASATKVTVKSQDGFTASYAVDSGTRGRTSGLKAGDEVLVVATKEGAKAVVITAIRGAG